MVRFSNERKGAQMVFQDATTTYFCLARKCRSSFCFHQIQALAVRQRLTAVFLGERFVHVHSTVKPRMLGCRQRRVRKPPDDRTARPRLQTRGGAQQAPRQPEGAAETGFMGAHSLWCGSMALDLFGRKSASRAYNHNNGPLMSEGWFRNLGASDPTNPTFFLRC